MTRPLNLRERLFERGIRMHQFLNDNGLLHVELSKMQSGKREPGDRYVLAVQDALGIEREEAIRLLRMPATRKTADTPFNAFLLAHGKRPIEVAETAGLSVHAVESYCCGRVRRPHPKAIRALAFAIGCPVEEVVQALEANPGRKQKRREHDAAVRARARAVGCPADLALQQARLGRVMAQAERCKGLRIASQRAYDLLRELVQDATACARWLSLGERRFLARLETALEHYQAVHRLERVAA